MSPWLPRKLHQQEIVYMQGKAGQCSSFLTLPFRYSEKNLFLLGILGCTVNKYFPAIHSKKRASFDTLFWRALWQTHKILLPPHRFVTPKWELWDNSHGTAPHSHCCLLPQPARGWTRVKCADEQLSHTQMLDTQWDQWHPPLARGFLTCCREKGKIQSWYQQLMISLGAHVGEVCLQTYLVEYNFHWASPRASCTPVKGSSSQRRCRDGSRTWRDPWCSEQPWPQLFWQTSSAAPALILSIFTTLDLHRHARGRA